MGYTVEYDVNHKFFALQESREFYFLLTGLSYEKIAREYYDRNKNKFVYQIRKIMKEFCLQNRRQLAYFAVKNRLVQSDKIQRYIDCLNR